MRGWLVGLVIGLGVGAGAMYLVLRPPWGHGVTAVPADAGVVAAAPSDAGAGKPKRQPRPRTARPSQASDGDELAPVVLTASERSLEWRGDAVALPQQRLDLSTGGEARALEDGEINTTVAHQTAGLRRCVVHGATGTDLRATITIKLVVDGSGRVAQSKLQAPRYLFDKGLLECARRELARMRFPASGAPTLVTFPVNLG